MRKLRTLSPLHSLYNQFNLDPKMRSDLNHVVLSLACFMVYFPITTGAAITGFASKLGAGDFFYSLLIGLPVLGNVLQMFASVIIERTNKRKKLLIISGFMNRLPWFFVGLVPLLVGDSVNPLFFIIPLLIMSSIPNGMVGVGFNSWMSDLIPRRLMGRYLGTRESIGTFVSMISTLLVSLFLDSNNSYTAYAILFAIASIMGMLDISNFIFITDTPMERHPHPPIKEFIKKAFADLSYRSYVGFWAMWILIFNLSSAFYNLYALTYLELSFVQLAIAGQIAYSVVASVAAPRWGRWADSKGIKFVLMRAGIISSIIPAIMLFSVKGSIWTFLIFNLLNGLSQTAINTTAQTMLLQSTPSKNRTMYIAGYSVTTSICAFAGFLIGGAFLEMQANLNWWSGTSFMDRYKLLFVIVGLLRLVLVLTYTPRMAKRMNIKS